MAGPSPGLFDAEQNLWSEDGSFDSSSSFCSSPEGLSAIEPSAWSEEDCSMEVSLMHKPRGSAGNWQHIQQGEKVRVTKGKGKRLRLEVRLAFKHDRNSLQVHLRNGETNPPVHTTAGFVLESAKMVGTNYLEMEVKLLLMSKNLQFWVHLTDLHGQLSSGHTVEFVAHNSGAALANRKTPQQLAPLSLYAVPATETSDFTVDPSLAEAVESPREMDRKRKMPPEMDSTVLPGDLEVRGSVKARSFVQFSDLRLKANVAELVDAMRIVTSLEGKTYYWKEGTVQSEQNGRRVIGLIAQEVQKVLPEVVHEDPESGLLSVSYSEILPVVIEAFKSFLQEYKDDKEEIQSQLQSVRSKLDSLNLELRDSNQQHLLHNISQSSAVLIRSFEANSSIYLPMHPVESTSLYEPMGIYEPQGIKTGVLRNCLTFCKFSQLCFAVMFAVSLMLVIVGLLLIVINMPEDRIWDENVPITNSTTSFSPNSKMYLSFLSAFQSNNQTNVDDPTNEPNDRKLHDWRKHNFTIGLLFGLILFVIGVAGMIISSVGLCCCSVWMCSPTYGGYTREIP